MRKLLKERLPKAFLILLILILIIFCSARLYYSRLVFETPVFAAYSINHQDISSHDYQMFRIIGRGKEDFTQTLYLRNDLERLEIDLVAHVTHDTEMMVIIPSIDRKKVKHCSRPVRDGI
ncbi:MAG: hypothetical protein LBJ67_13790 [Planctomycetaceae bacterium]|jgi:hypothetical protein|nr:hypothetical protein [Planctomycetaceae bacterium]